MATKTVDPKKSAASKKAAETRRANKDAEEKRQQEQKNTSSRNWLPWAIILAALILGLLIGHPWTVPTATEAPTAALTEPPVVATEAPTVAPTEPPVVATEAPTEPPTPVAVICDTPYIKASLDGSTWTEQGEFLDTVLGKRMTFTNRKVVVPSKAWNVPLTAAELKLVEQTWVNIQLCVVKGQNATLFASAFEQGLNRYETGVLLSLKPGMYEFRIRNGELVIWYPEQQAFSSKDLERIFDQIRVGNFDIKSPLDFFGVSTDLLPLVPQDLVEKYNVQIVPSLDPTVQ